MSSTISMLLSAALFALAVTASAQAPQSLISRLQGKVIANGGCNINVCFAIDGSGSVRQSGFDAEKQFVLDVKSIVTVAGRVGLAATQFGATNSPIIQLTTSTRDFSNALSRATFLNGRATNIRDGLSFCVTELRRRSGPKKIVVLTDGRANRGGDPAPVADSFRATGGEVCAVGVGFRDESSLLDLAGGDSERVLNVNDFFRLADILEDLIDQVCGFGSGPGILF